MPSFFIFFFRKDARLIARRHYVSCSGFAAFMLMPRAYLFDDAECAAFSLMRLSAISLPPYAILSPRLLFFDARCADYSFI